MLARGTYNIQQGGTLQRPGPAVISADMYIARGNLDKEKGKPREGIQYRVHSIMPLYYSYDGDHMVPPLFRGGGSLTWSS